eukprot:scaffold4244_cov167-Amphora_coffeaeformis.AAC.8
MLSFAESHSLPDSLSTAARPIPGNKTIILVVIAFFYSLLARAVWYNLHDTSRTLVQIRARNDNQHKNPQTTRTPCIPPPLIVLLVRVCAKAAERSPWGIGVVVNKIKLSFLALRRKNTPKLATQR